MKFFFYLWVIICSFLEWKIPFYFRNFLLNELIFYLRLQLFQLQSKNKFTIEKNLEKLADEEDGAVGATTATVLSSPTYEPNNNKHSRLWPKPTGWFLRITLTFTLKEKLWYDMKINKYYSHGAVWLSSLCNNNIWLHCKNYYRRIQFLIKCKIKNVFVFGKMESINKKLHRFSALYFLIKIWQF